MNTLTGCRSLIYAKMIVCTTKDLDHCFIQQKKLNRNLSDGGDAGKTLVITKTIHRKNVNFV